MLNHGLLSYTYVYLILYTRSRLPRTVWVHSNNSLEVGFPDVLGLANIPYSSSIWYFMKSWPINYEHWSCVISIGLRYLDNHVVSSNFVVDIAHLLSYCFILHHPATGSIIVTTLRFKSIFLPLFLWQGDLLYLHIVCSVVFP